MTEPYLPHLGRFSDDGRRYTITSPRTPHGWVHYLHNDEHLARVDARGAGESFYRRPDGSRTYLSLHADWPRRVYVRDEDGVVVCVPGADSRLTITPGTAEFSVDGNDLTIAWRLAVPDGLRGECWHVTVRNTACRPRTLLVVAAYPLMPHGYPTPFGYDSSIDITCDRDLGALFFDNRDPDRPDPLYNAFMAQDAAIHSFDTSSATFLGDGGFDAPAGVAAGRLADRINCSMSVHAAKLAALASEHRVAAGGDATLKVLVGVAGDLDEVAAIRRRWLADAATIPAAVAETRAAFRRTMDRVQVRTPDVEFDRLVNDWLGYNLAFTARWTRLYSRGFRDCMQDTQGVASLDPAIARANLLEAMPHVYRSGRCRRAWAAGKGALLEQYYADQPVWVAPAVKSYLAETADRGIFEQVRPYFDGGQGSVWEHLVACQRHLYDDRGEHGLCRIHEGDWCDTAHRLGVGGRGESVWLTMAHHRSLLDFAEIATWLGRPAPAAEARGWAAELHRAVNEQGWDGAWFSIAFNDDGRRIGTACDAEGRVFLAPQAWSVIAEVTSPARQVAAMAAVDEHLDSWVGPYLLYPPFTKTDPTIGALTGFHPGTCENGPCYCHAAAFKIVADCLLGRGDAAFATFRTIMPGGDADRRAPEPTCPPFAFTNSRVAAYHPHDAGKHGGVWTTGTVSWCFQAAGQYILGARPTLDGLVLDPCLPAAWPEAAIRRRYRGAWYEIRIANPRGVCKGVRELRLDGEAIDGNRLPVLDAGEHHVELVMG